MKTSRLFYALFFVSTFSGFGCLHTGKALMNQAVNEYYTVEDFKSVEKIDAHTHLRSDDSTYIKLAAANNFRLNNINVYKFTGQPIEEQQKVALKWIKAFPGISRYATTFSLQHFSEKGWLEETLAWLKNSFALGATAVKIWKNIGMELKDNNGKLVMIDDPAFDPVLDYIAQNKIPVIGHLGEPKNCWLPIDSMTVAGDKKYFSEHPNYHMYLHPELPSYLQQIRARDHMLEKHPDLIFIGAHLGSLEWSVDELGKRLDKFPNMAIDMAARISHLRYQAVNNRQKVYEFFIKYQDRILYGTDIVADTKKSSEQISILSTDMWLNDWKFFVTGESMTVPQVEGTFRGLKLPKPVIDKIYRLNAERWLPAMKKI